MTTSKYSTQTVEYLARSLAQAIVELSHERDTLAAQVEKLTRRATGVAAKRHTDAVSVSPKGYETVLTYLARWHPEILDQIDWRLPDATLRDGYWCFHRTKGKEVWVKAPKCFANKRHITKVRAYPLAILKERFGD
jgi:hypothetical protein